MYFFKNRSILWPLLTSLVLLFTVLNARQERENNQKKKLVILTSKGGFGHMAACDSLQSTLGQNYDIQIVNPFEEILGKIDFVKKVSFHRYDCEQLYNKILNQGWLRIFNFNARYLIPRIILNMNKTIERLFVTFLEKTQPDLLISVIPVLNLSASNAAWRCKIPYLMITLDYDLTMWLIGMNKAQHNNITITVADQYTQKCFLSQKYASKFQNIYPLGVPIRKTFFEKRESKKIKKEWGIPDNKPVVMLLMGGVGSTQTYHYFKKLARFSHPIHILVCTGRNIGIQKKISQVKCNPLISYSCIPFTLKIPDLMTASDLLITKPGPGTVTEAMIMKLPVLLDHTVTSLFWEKKVFELIKRYGIGQEVRTLSKLNACVESMLFNAKHRTSIKHALTQIPPYHFDRKIKHLVKQLCHPTV